jgi:YD repeat-containing protein
MGRDGARYEHWATRSNYWGSMLGWLGDRWGLVLPNGTRYVFRACGTRAAPNGRCTLIGILDAAGNELSFLRDDEGRLVKIETPNRRWVRLQYDAAGRITDARASDGTRIDYEYDGGGHLIRATRSDGTVHAYDYDARGLLVRMKDVAGTVVENEYDSDRRTTRQVVTYEADARGYTRPADVFEFHYVVEAKRIARAEVVRPGGERQRLTFDEARYVMQESWQYPDGRSTTIDYAIDAGLNRVTSVLVSCTGADGATTSLTARVAPGMSHKRVAATLSAQCGLPVADD